MAPLLSRIAGVNLNVLSKVRRALPRPGFVDFLLVGGGGGGYNGGAGGFIYTPAQPVQSGVEYTVQVGSGANAAPGNPTFYPTTGGPSKVYLTSNPSSNLGSKEAFGGGNGSNYYDGGTGTPGGSGGGNFGYPTAFPAPGPQGAAGTPGQGYPGGDGFRGPNVEGYYPRNGGGGGGAGGRGQNASYGTDGAGGLGVYNDITGTNVYYAAGGNGGGGSPSGSTIGGGGGSVGYQGTVIFRYPKNNSAATVSSPNYTDSPYGNYRVYIFYAPGTITF